MSWWALLWVNLGVRAAERKGRRDPLVGEHLWTAIRARWGR